MSEVDSNFKKTYLPLVQHFIQDIEGLNILNLPEPFIPVYGKSYDNSKYKIAFVGWETRNNSSLQDFFKEAKLDLVESLYRFDEDIDNLEFTNYGNNFGSGFWDFNLNFLSKFYNIGDWKKLRTWRNENIEHEEILKSFIWGNMDAIERFEVTAKGQGGSFEDWLKVKKASKDFDKAHHLLNAFAPEIMIVLHQNKYSNDNWLTDGISKYVGPEILSEHLKYYYLIDTQTHVFWTAHPGSLHRNGGIEPIIYQILNSINEKGIFPDFPGQDWLMIKKRKKELFAILKSQLNDSAVELGLSTSDYNWGVQGKESDFYFEIPSSKHKVSIVFSFDKWRKDFTIGVYVDTTILSHQSDLYKELKEAISEKLNGIIGKRPNTYPNWLYIFLDTNNLNQFNLLGYKNWDDNSELWDGVLIGETKEKLMRIVSTIYSAIKDIDLLVA